MALTVNHHRYKQLPLAKPNSHQRSPGFLLPLPSKSSPINMSMKETSTKSVKDETFDCEIIEVFSPLTNTIDYTIIDSEIDRLHPDNHQLQAIALKDIYNNNNIKKPRQKIVYRELHMLSMSALGNTLTNFDHRSASSSNQTSTTIKQQPFSPPPYHPLTNGFFTQHHHHHRQHHHHQQQQQRMTPSPNHEQISPISNNLAETSSTPSMVPPTATGGALTVPEDKRRCAVCNDIASGYHYGVWSCEGCKAFFKRSIQGTNEYICPATNTCTIDKHRRKSCQACRLRRCYEVGMTKGTTRRERKYRKKAVSVCKITSTSSNSNAVHNMNGNNLDHGLLVTANNITPPTTAGTPLTSQMNNNNNNNNPFSSPQLQMNKLPSDSTRIPITPAEFIATLSQASRLNLPAKADTSRPLTDQYFLQLLAKIFDQELVVLINWAKAMPGYTESLTLDQQVTIIEQSWLDTLILDVIERSVERNDDTLHFAPDFIVSRNRDLSSPGLGAICTSLFNILQAFKDPRTTHEEFIALKATLLINSVPASMMSPATTKSFRLLTNQIYQAIQYTCDSNPSVYHDNYIRHFTLLLQLPHIKMLSLKLIRLFLDMRANDLLPQADLLLEMLDAQDAFDMNNSFLSLNTDINSLTTHTPSFSPSLSINNNNSASPSLVNNSKVQSDYQMTNNYNQKQDSDNTNELNGQMNYRTTSSPMLYTSAPITKISPTTSPLQYYKHSHSETIPTSSPTNMHFQINNPSY